MESEYPISRPTVLVVDDHPDQLSALFTDLHLNGYSLLIAQNGAAAFTVLDRVRPDLILLDVRLPDMDGFEICRRLKQSGTWREIPVLFTTGITELESKVEGFQAGGADYITKPFQLEEVLARIKTHLTIRQLQCALQLEKERFKGLSDVTFEGILLHDQGRIIEVNQTLERMFGFSREELLECHVHDLLTPEFKELTE
jgi:DNA-binding response OmpR family regulator